MEYQQYQGVLNYCNNSILKPRPFYHTDFDKGIEKIIQEEPVEEKGLTDRVFSDKTKTLKATIKALFNETNIRERLDYELVKRIDDDICKCKSYLLEVKFLNQPYSLNPDLTGRRTKLENQIFSLEQERRRTYLECWKDLFELKKELLSSLKDYWLISKRKHSLNIEDDKCRGYMQEIEAYNWQRS